MHSLKEAIESPTAWFAVLERARRTGQPDLERRAIAELRRLGVEVQFSDHQQKQDRGAR